MKDPKQYVERYYKGRKVASITTENNVLGEPVFEVVKFDNGDYITLARGMSGDLFRCSGGGDHGWREDYEHMIPKKERERLEQNSDCPPGKEWVKGFTKNDGTRVHGYCREICDRYDRNIGR